MERRDVVIVGGGIAGLSVALPLARAGRRPLLLEAEPALASQASGRNAAVWLAAHDDATTPELARRSRALLDVEWPAVGAPWCSRTGAVIAAEDAAELAPWERGARRAGMEVARIEVALALRLAPALAGGAARAALLLPEAGVLALEAIADRLAQAAARAGAELRTGARVARVGAHAGHVDGVELADGARIAADAVVLAAGAWSGALGASCGAPLPLTPLRRHLALLDPPDPALAGDTVVWWASDALYWRPEAGGALASPCDEEPCEAGEPTSDPAALALLAAKLRAVAPALAGSPLRRSWACLRTFAPDRELVAGPDPRVAGLVWLAGLGGRGMTVGLAAGELCADALLGKAHPLHARVSPDRLA